jgi:hypothetical protein
MAALTTDQQKAVWHAFIESGYRTGAAKWNKAGLVAAVVAANQWMDDNQAAFVTYLNTNAPAFGGANSTATEKTLLFIYVLLARQGML